MANFFMKRPGVKVKEVFPKLKAPVLEPFFGLIALSFQNSQKEEEIWGILNYLDNTTKYYLISRHQFLFEHTPLFRNRLMELENSLDKRFCSLSTLTQVVENINKGNYVIPREAIYQLVGKFHSL